MPRPTDFYSTTPTPWPAVRAPRGALERLLPRPREVGDGEPGLPLRAIGRAAALSMVAADGGSIAWRAWLTAELARRRITTSFHDVAGSDGTNVRFLSLANATARDIARRLGVSPPEHDEGYSLVARDDGRGVTAVARTDIGLLRAAATFAMLARRDDRGDVVLPRLEIADWPVIELRILGGWALARGERLREAIDLAVAFRANRVLYNWWGWVPGDRLWREDEYLVRHARERGVELICELRRMSFGMDYRITEPDQRARIVGAFVDAARAGFRSFGLLFDDVAWETAEDECALVSELRTRLADAIGAAPEFFACPQIYWCPGQMSLAWTGGAEPDETLEQRRYLETWGRLLPADVEVYIANYWADFPGDYASALRSGFTELVGRQPVFFDNQLINDYRLGAILPFALHARPVDLGEHLRGYLLNAPRPLDAHAPSAASALAYAWNPRGYDPSLALGAAIDWLHGGGPRAAAVVAATEELRTLANEWADGEFTATNHYRTIGRQILTKRADGRDIARWRERLAIVRAALLVALGTPAPDALPQSARGLAQWLASCDRLDSDLDFFAAFVATRDRIASGANHSERGDAIDAFDAFDAAAASARRRALAQVAEVLPRQSGIELHVEANDGSSDDDSADAHESPAWSWAEYFYRNSRREFAAAARELRAALADLTAARDSRGSAE